MANRPQPEKDNHPLPPPNAVAPEKPESDQDVEPADGLTKKLHGTKQDRSPERPSQQHEPDAKHPFEDTLDF